MSDKDKKPDNGHGELVIHIDGKPYKAPKPVMTGAEIKALGNVPAGYVLVLVVPGPKGDKPIPDDLEVTLEPGMHFNSSQDNTSG